MEAKARDFIIDNCITCQFHELVHVDNLGITILEENEKLQNEKRKKSEDELSTAYNNVVSSVMEYALTNPTLHIPGKA
ncbi:hypothetical protein [Daejeonella sp. JGW-45]|uniref:hypothetical protein n=1 Tax=Daejeonella sp. JGW-45 TaxID=3034148 RepID=UPI0023EBBDC1|nr:hypothetical protein [Daejeonella sp. JGW-45]